MEYRYRIKEYREKLKMTQEELAAKSGVSRTIISGLEQGKIKTTTTKTIISIAEALNTTVGEIFLQD
ncbi:MAG TPA: helix-turn-helix transcriptional regulator [Firmicutes bacterium]|nr:helix-turn-helix transcriptional regulator [Bacillota bacterium]